MDCHYKSTTNYRVSSPVLLGHLSMATRLWLSVHYTVLTTNDLCLYLPLITLLSPLSLWLEICLGPSTVVNRLPLFPSVTVLLSMGALCFYHFLLFINHSSEVFLYHILSSLDFTGVSFHRSTWFSKKPYPILVVLYHASTTFLSGFQTRGLASLRKERLKLFLGLRWWPKILGQESTHSKIMLSTKTFTSILAVRLET